MSRDGPGLLLRDIERGKDKDIAAALETIQHADADVLVLQGLDWDLENRALTALATRLAEAQSPYPHRLGLRPNRGTQSGLDLNSNGRIGDPQDAIGYGLFTGANGLAVLSRHPIDRSAVTDFSRFLWADLPDALLPYPGMPESLPRDMPLSTTSHALVPIDTVAHGRLTLGVFGATTPVFDGAEDRNGRRNHDEVTFWAQFLDGNLPAQAPPGFLLAGNANLDPTRGDGRRAAITRLLSHPNLQDPAPEGDLGIATVDFGSDSAGALRVAYLLPDQSWQIDGSGMITSPLHRHRLIWVDLTRRP